MPIFNSLLTFKSHRNANDEYPMGFDRSRLTIQQDMLVRSLLNEFYSSAKLTATFASIVSARRRGLKLQNVSRPVAYIPSDPLIFPAVAAGLSPALDNHALMNGLQDYYARVAFARALSEISALVGEADDLGHRELAQLDDVWQQVCALANIVAHHLFDVENVDDPARKYQLISIQELINAAKSGRSPCVRSDGTVFVPGWLDQRREERLAAGWQVWIEYGGLRERATLKDISASGMGLITCTSRPAGTQITVQLQGARCLAGIVAWSNNTQMGVRLLRPLLATDPLLTAGYGKKFESTTLN